MPQFLSGTGKGRSEVGEKPGCCYRGISCIYTDSAGAEGGALSRCCRFSGHSREERKAAPSSMDGAAFRKVHSSFLIREINYNCGCSPSGSVYIITDGQAETPASTGCKQKAAPSAGRDRLPLPYKGGHRESFQPSSGLPIQESEGLSLPQPPESGL